MAIIQITPEVLNSKANEVRSLKSQHDDTMAKLRSLVLSLNETWKGEAQDAFVAKFESMPVPGAMAVGEHHVSKHLLPPAASAAFPKCWRGTPS